jgi:hypothetical protein
MYNQSVELYKSKTGELGERLVAKHFRNLGIYVEESLDLFDRTKDMTVDGLICEVKTQQLWHKEQAFTIKPNQLNKCQEVDILIFVETPSKYNGNKVMVYEFTKDKRHTKTMETSDGRVMHLFPKSNAKLLTTISDSGIVNQFNEYTVSKFR